jgi:methyl-accepting chemotaxis protein
MSFQFQDITRQRIEHVIEPLSMFHLELDEILNSLHTIDKDLDNNEQVDVDKWLKQFYTMADERRIMEDTLRSKKEE